MKVLLVDDSLIIRQRIIKLLTTMKEVEIVGEAQNAPDATNLVLLRKPDVVILDLQLIESTGFEVLRSAKKDKPSPLVIILTNFPYPQFRRLSLNAGADFFFDKSTEFDKIMPLFKQLIQGGPRPKQGDAPGSNGHPSGSDGHPSGSDGHSSGSDGHPSGPDGH